MSLNPTISFVIPAYNEAGTIKNTLDEISKIDPEVIGYEVIVVDHNSKDKTGSIAKECGATVLHKVGGYVSSVRNFGVENSKGEILVFLDADVLITDAWRSQIINVIREIKIDNSLIAGSHCSPPEDPDNFIEKYWFGHYSTNSDSRSIGTGHMIMSRKLFYQAGGFDENLQTGEDYDFCQKAVACGGQLTIRNELKVIHVDYPKTISSFISREKWHGYGDCTSLQKIISSKVALAAIVFVSLHIIAIISIFVKIELLAVTALLLFVFLNICSYSKYRHSGYKIVLINTFIFYFYFVGRTLSFSKLFR